MALVDRNSNRVLVVISDDALRSSAQHQTTVLDLCHSSPAMPTCMGWCSLKRQNLLEGRPRRTLGRVSLGRIRVGDWQSENTWTANSNALHTWITKADERLVADTNSHHRCQYPNDEGLPEHPLWNHGLSDIESSIVEVAGSPWLAEVRVEQERSAKRIWGGRGMMWTPTTESDKHFVVTAQGNYF